MDKISGKENSKMADRHEDKDKRFTFKGLKVFVYDSVIKNPSKELKDYDEYHMTLKAYLIYTAIALLALGGLTYVFYRSLWVWLLLSPLSLCFPRYRKKQLITKQKQELLLQFKEALYVIAASLTAGKSVEMAFRSALSDLRILYIDPETPIIRELEIIIRKMELNGTIEEALLNFSKRAHLEDVRSFADVFVTCKRRGGNMVEVIKNTSNTVADKIRTREEIETLITEKKFEQKVLNAMPIVMIFILNSSSPEFMAPVYTTAMGRMGMTMAVVLFALAYGASERIMRIEV